jgi:hypothetical protein
MRLGRASSTVSRGWPATVAATGIGPSAPTWLPTGERRGPSRASWS